MSVIPSWTINLSAEFTGLLFTNASKSNIVPEGELRDY